MVKRSLRSHYSQATIGLVSWLRYRGRNPNNSQITFSSYQSIATAVGTTVHQVRTICKQLKGSKGNAKVSREPRFKKLSMAIRNYIIDDDTLEKHKHLSLAARCVQIHRRHPEIKISQSQLRQFYLSNGITYKEMKSKKSHTPNAFQKINNARFQSFQQLLEAERAHEKIIYIDETIFQPHSVQKKSWAKKYQNQIMYKQSRTNKTISAAVCLSGDEGILTYILREKSIRNQELIELINALREKIGQGSAVIFLDNLRAHHSKYFIERAKELNFKIIFNAAYSPEYHCIEEVFSLVKAKYRNKILESNFILREDKHIEIIRSCFQGISSQTVKKIEMRHFKKMDEFVSKQ